MIGERIRTAREKLGISQKELAHDIGMHPNTIARWERGEILPRGTSIAKLSKALNTNSAYLLEGKNPENSSESSMNFTLSQGNNENNGDRMKKQNSVEKNSGMASFTFGNGRRFEAPATPEGYEFLMEMAARVLATAI